MSLQSDIKLLFVDDEPSEYALLSRTVSMCESRYQVQWAKTVGEAIEQLKSTGFDAILLDLMLPDSLGVQSIERIRQIDSVTPIVILTSQVNNQAEMEAMMRGAQDFLIKKDLNAHTLEIAIKHAIHRQQCVVRIEQLVTEIRHQQVTLGNQTELLERKNRKLKKLYRTAHKFVDNVSHEFRTPLTVIKDYISLVREGMVGEVNGEQQQMLDIAAVRADDLNNMVDDMLDVSKLQSGLLGVWRNNNDVNEVIKNAIPSLVQKAHVKKINFEIDIEDDLPQVFCDCDKMSRIIINLITNAMKFCGEPGHVKLSAHFLRETNEVQVSVADNGPGIEPDQLEVIFKRFKQLKQTTKNSTKGFGLGLSIAKELVDLNLGKMQVTSKLGEGSTFSFTVPVDNPPCVFRLYLERMARSMKSTFPVSLIRVQLDESVSEVDAEELNIFFHYLLRQQDLQFRSDVRSWLMIINASETEINKYIAHTKNEFKKTNRNRPRGQLPEFELDLLGTWNAAAQRDELSAIVEGFYAAGHAAATDSACLGSSTAHQRFLVTSNEM